MIDWVELTEEEKASFVKMANDVPVNCPTVFNLESDKHDCGGRFAEMTREQVIAAAEESAEWILGQNFSK
jgi:hypothetical protein